MNTLQAISQIKAYLQTEDKSILSALLEDLQAEYSYQETRKKGGSSALKRQKTAEKILRNNKKDCCRPQFHIAWIDNINGQDMQIFGTPYYLFAINIENKMAIETDITANNHFNIKPLITDNTERHIQSYNIADIKQQKAEWAALQRQKPAKQRQPFCKIQVAETLYNADYFMSIIDILGENAELYQPASTRGISLFKSEVGQAILCPCT